ncbi:C39 family peptidase [Nocardioides aurantiacus]|uniref:Peptidase C39-like protein n=1 Tax=Nocardioides aurantiacus TaxID=86796 RepID=A0A3N2CY82_9ACTN|nr:C39 family peptidase [Nocardioides aurantiacus]ROR92492.1 peptidase C39-like protein [Nocardioides aurantiacus]
MSSRIRPRSHPASTLLGRFSGRLPGRFPVRVRALGAGFVALALVGVALTEGGTASAPELAQARLAAGAAQHTFRQVTTDAGFRTGTSEGVRIGGGAVTLATPIGRTTYTGKSWELGRWTSAWSRPAHSFDELVPSWDTTTPPNTHVQVKARVVSTSGRTSTWKVLGHYSTRDAAFRRTSAGTQSDAVASVATDTVRAAPGVRLQRYQLRVLVLRLVGHQAAPSVRSLQAVASSSGALQPVSRPLLRARSLAVPRYSQMVHRGEYPQYGGGGQAWCSPTSLSMILGYYGALPPAQTYAWVSSSYRDRFVDHVARAVYDYGYRGAGNWAFTTAYAAQRTGGAFVTRLSSLRDAERFIASGVPLAASVSFSRGQLTGAPISSTNGHLVVITGFTANGDVVVNDPAAASNATVRRVYDRAQFERVWQRGSRGTVYVVHDAAHPLPAW